MTGAPAHSGGFEPDSFDGDAMPAAEEELHLALRSVVIVNPTFRVPCDGDPLLSNPRDAGGLSGRVQCELGHDEAPCIYTTQPSIKAGGLETCRSS
eukprot:9471816-Pyramimonas_sp.AAC.1